MFQWNLWDNGFSFRKTLLNTSNDSDKKPIITEPQNFVIDWMLAILLSGYCVSTRRWEVFVKCSFCVDLIAAGIWRIVRYLVRSRAGCTASRARFQSGISLERVQSVTNTYQEYLNYSRVTHVDELKIRISTHFEICYTFCIVMIYPVFR